MGININVQTNDDKVTISLAGRFDFNSHREFRSAYEEAIIRKSVNELEVNLAGVDYIDSAALGMLLLLNEKAAAVNKKVSLVNCRRTVLQILEVANFNKLFPIR